MRSSQIAAGIVTYNPNIERLEENIQSISKQVCAIVISDNASENITSIENIIKKYHIKLFKNNENQGIAYGLNQCINYVQQKGYKWIITLDQDSVCPLNIIEESNKFLSQKDVAIIVPLIKESNSGELCFLGERNNGEEWQEVKKCITSAAITSIQAWKAVEGFDEGLFIDYVDYDFAMKVRLKNYKIIRMNTVVLDHQIGNSEVKKFFNYKLRVANHPAFRKYYIARNMMIYVKRYYKDINLWLEVMRIIKVFLVILFYEKDKADKLKAYLCGIRDGIKYRCIK